METVKYVDEDPVTYRRQEDRALLEAMKYGLGMTIREAHLMLERMIAEGLDPIEAEGAAFQFGGFLDVPEPNAKVNWFEAKEECGRQIKACQMLLESPVDRAELVLRNSISWCRFWSVRAPTQELRDAFGKSLRRLVDGPCDA